MVRDQQAGWRPRAGRRSLRTVVVGGILATAFGTAAWAAIHQLVFEDLAGVSDVELAEMRGGFTLPSLPDVEITFGFRIESLATLPDLPDLPDLGLPVAVTPTLVAVLDHGDAPSTVVGPTGAVPDLAGERIGSTTDVRFSDPTRATVHTVETQDGAVVSETRELVDLTRETITLQVGRPNAALITQQLDARQVTTLMESVLGNTTLQSHVAASIELNGWDRFRSSLPSVATVRSIRAVEDAVKMSLR